MMHTQSMAWAWGFRQAGTQEWFLAHVPGCAHIGLLALSLIPAPFVGDNERRVQRVDEADWEYRYQSADTPDISRQPHIYPGDPVSLTTSKRSG